MRTIEQFTADLFQSCKTALTSPENKKSRFSNLSLEAQDDLNKNALSFADLCRYSGKQRHQHRTKHDGHTDTLFILLNAFKDFLLQPLPTYRRKEFLIHYGLVPRDDTSESNYFDRIRGINFYDLLEIGLYGHVNTIGKTGKELETRTENLIYVYAAERQHPDSLFTRAAPEIIGTVFSNQRRNQAPLPFEPFYLYAPYQLYLVKFDITRSIQPTPDNDQGYEIAQPIRTWCPEEQARKTKLEAELVILQAEFENTQNKNGQEKLLSAIKTTEVVLKANKQLPFYIEQYYFLPMKFYHHIMQNIENELNQLVRKKTAENCDQKTKVDCDIKIQLLSNIKTHLTNNYYTLFQDQSDLFFIYQLLNTLQLVLPNESDLTRYREMMPTPRADSEMNDLCQHIAFQAVKTLGIPEFPRKNAAEREIFFAAFQKANSIDEVWKILDALSAARNLFLPKDKQKESYAFVLSILGLEKLPAITDEMQKNYKQTIETLINILFEDVRNSHSTKAAGVEQSVLSTIRCLNETPTLWNADNTTFTDVYKKSYEAQTFLVKLKNAVQINVIGSSDITSREEPLDSYKLFFRVMGRSHKLDPAGKDGNTKRLQYVLEFLKLNLDKMPESVRKSLFGNKTAADITHLDLLAIATGGTCVLPDGQDTVTTLSTRNQNLIYFYSEANQQYRAYPQNAWHHTTAQTDLILKKLESENKSIFTAKFALKVNPNNRDELLLSEQSRNTLQDLIAELRDVCKLSPGQQLFKSSALKKEYSDLLGKGEYDDANASNIINLLMQKITTDFVDPTKRAQLIDLFAPLGLLDCKGCNVAHPNPSIMTAAQIQAASRELHAV